jgi:uncharacterized membrane protein YbhN (UPF0104 family)
VVGGLTPIYLFAALAVCLLALHPRTFALLTRLPGGVGRVLADVTLPRGYWLVALACYYIAFWLLFGLVFWDFCQAIEPSVPLQVAVSSLTLSFLVGFLAFFAPGGIGVREAVLYGLVSGYASPASALAIAIGSRVFVMGGEALSLTTAWASRPR